MQKLYLFLQNKSQDFVNQSAHILDLLILSAFTCIITFNPYFLWGKINTFELGIYLPGINAVLSGDIPYRDFFYLRGPLELYVPALFMQIFGTNIGILSLYFYIGTIICLIFCILIGKELYKTRLSLYLMTFVLIARTFPRVIFTFWGGMRFALGILALFFAIKHFKKKKTFWIILSGIASSLAFFTSIEIGITSMFAVFSTLFVSFFIYSKDKKSTFYSGINYTVGLLLIVLPYFLHLHFTQSLSHYFDITLSVITSMSTFPNHLIANNPKTFIEVIASMNPGSDHFKHLTPAYCYIFLFSLIIFKIKQKKTQQYLLPLICTFSYGIFMYYLAFRNLEAGQFEMALQPEKILLFFILEEVFLFILERKTSLTATLNGSVLNRIKTKARFKIYGINLLIFLFLGSSIGYPIQRYNHRFFAAKYLTKKLAGKNTNKIKPLYKEDSVLLILERIKGFRVPIRQANNLKKLSSFINNNTSINDKVFLSPELGTHSFVINRPFVGRFPVVSFSWIKDEWHNELFDDLKKEKPQYAVLSKDKSIAHLKVFFQIKRNKDKYFEIYDYIQNHYSIVSSTPDLNIYKRNDLYQK